VTNVTGPPRLAHSAREVFFSRLAAGLKRNVRISRNTPKEPAMKTFRDDAATALVTVTLAIATVSTFLVVFLGAV
jgi:hypothetical protein